MASKMSTYGGTMATPYSGYPTPELNDTLTDVTTQLQWFLCSLLLIVPHSGWQYQKL